MRSRRPQRPAAPRGAPNRIRPAVDPLRVVLSLCLLGLVAWGSPSLAENIDPSGNDARFAWGENVGWFNARPLGPGGPGLQVDDFEVTGWMFGENTGWVSLSCKNTASCDRVLYGVRHDGAGNLFGHAWAENLGWIDFMPLIGGAPVAGAGVTIDLFSGEFDGTAWSENTGWLNFGLAQYGLDPIRTAWTCDPGAPGPTMAPLLQVDHGGGGTSLLVSGAGDATGHDIVAGDLLTLQATGGDFRAATSECVADNSTFDSVLSPDAALGPGEGIWFVVRGVTCSGTGTYDAPGVPGAPSQVGSRDVEIDASSAACP